MRNLLNNLKNGFQEYSSIIIFLDLLIALAALITALYIGINCNKWQTEKEEFVEKYDIDKIVEKYEKDLKQKNTTSTFPLDFRFEDQDLIIECSTFNTENRSQINASISGYLRGDYRFSATQEGDMVLKGIVNRIKDFLELDKNTIIKVVVVGSADATQPKSNLVYNGEFGNTTEEIRYYKNDDETKPFYKRFIKDKTPIVNLDFALFRAYDIVEYLTHNIPNIDNSNVKIFVNEYDEIGEEYRRCDFSITLENVLLLQSYDYERLSWGAKQFIPKNEPLVKPK